jgi:hypothetical protein
MFDGNQLFVVSLFGGSIGVFSRTLAGIHSFVLTYGNV